MTQALLVARLRNTPTALERLIGFLRRRAFAMSRFSLAVAGDGILEVCLRFDDARTNPDRVRAELGNLIDLVELRELSPAQAEPTRELVVARVSANGARPGPEWRKVSEQGDDLVVELTGSPAEIEAALGSLGGVQALVRSGEVLVPPHTQLTQTGTDP